MFQVVTWANKDTPEYWKFQAMAYNGDHLLAELEAANIATFGALTGLPRYSAFFAIRIAVGSLTAHQVESMPSGPTDYELLNGSIASVAVGQQTLYFNNIVAKFWKPDGANYLSAWFRASPRQSGGLNVDYATFMLHRTPM